MMESTSGPESVFRLQPEDAPDRWPVVPVTIRLGEERRLEVEVGKLLPTGPCSPGRTEDDTEDAPLAHVAEAAVSADVSDALKRIYLQALPRLASAAVLHRLFVVYGHLLEESKQPGDKTSDEEPLLMADISAHVQRWMSTMHRESSEPQVAAAILRQYVMSTWQDAAEKAGLSVAEIIEAGKIGLPTPNTLATGQFAERTEPWLLKHVWALAAVVVEGLGLEYAEVRNLGLMLGIEQEAFPGETFRYIDRIPRPDMAPRA